MLGPRTDRYGTSACYALRSRATEPARPTAGHRSAHGDPSAGAERRPAEEPRAARIDGFAWHEMLSYDKSRDSSSPTGNIADLARATVARSRGSRSTRPRSSPTWWTSRTASTASTEPVEKCKLTLTGSPVHLVREDVELTLPIIEVAIPNPATLIVAQCRRWPKPCRCGPRQDGRVTFEWVEVNTGRQRDEVWTGDKSAGSANVASGEGSVGNARQGTAI